MELFGQLEEALSLLTQIRAGALTRPAIGRIGAQRHVERCLLLTRIDHFSGKQPLDRHSQTAGSHLFPAVSALTGVQWNAARIKNPARPIRRVGRVHAARTDGVLFLRNTYHVQAA
jgi:hypothetical protein